MKYENLWSDKSNESYINNTTNNIDDIMRAQCDYLFEDTEGKVFAVFGELRKNGSINSALNMIEYATKAVSGIVYEQETVDDVSTEKLIDANPMYYEKQYGFEICTEKYKYRPFEVKMTPVYPVEFVIDEEISNHIKTVLENYAIEGEKGNCYQVFDDDSFCNVLKQILNDRKVKYIVSEMRRRSEEVKPINLPQKVIICEGRTDEIIIHAIAQKMKVDVAIVVADGKNNIPSVFDGVRGKNNQSQILIIVDADNDENAINQAINGRIKDADFDLVVVENTIEDWFWEDTSGYSKLKLVQSIQKVVSEKSFSEIRKEQKSFNDLLLFLEK